MNTSFLKEESPFWPENETFELEVYLDKEKPKRYQFDNIDMITIEIFDLIQ